MKRVLNLLLTIAVFFGGWKLFPDVFWFENAGAVVITVLIKYIVSFLLGILLVFVAFSLMAALSNKVGMLILLFSILFLAVLFSNMIEVWLISKLYSGFQFNGNMLALFLTGLALSIFSVDVKSNSNETHSVSRNSYRRF